MVPPPFLFKYRSLSDENARTRAERIFTHNELYFAAPREFNDPFESRFRLSLDGTREEKIKKLSRLFRKNDSSLTEHDAVAQASNALLKAPASLAQTWGDQLVEGLRSGRDLAILSLAERPTDVLLWSHYADSHKGICLQFDTTACEIFRASIKVTYADSAPTLHWFTDDEITMFRAVTLGKGSQWRCEDEWRSIEFNRGAGVRSYSPNALAAVIFGLQTPHKDRAMVRRWCENRARVVRFVEVVREPGEYTLSLSPAP